MKSKNNLDQYLAILNSTRFQQITAAFLIQVARHYGYIDDFLANAITVWLGAVAGVGTVDRISDKK